MMQLDFKFLPHVYTLVWRMHTSVFIALLIPQWGDLQVFRVRFVLLFCVPCFPLFLLSSVQKIKNKPWVREGEAGIRD